jgi:hypothetical protein
VVDSVAAQSVAEDSVAAQSVAVADSVAAVVVVVDVEAGVDANQRYTARSVRSSSQMN